MSTRTRADAHTIEHLDFDVICDLQLVLDLTFHTFVLRKCRRKAIWLLTFPCCGHQSFSCQSHRNTVLVQECGRCGRTFDSVDMLTWVRL